MPKPTTVPTEYAELYRRFTAHLDSLGETISDHTRRAYRGRVAGYLAWLADCDPGQWHGDPLAEAGPARLAVASYRSHLLTVSKRAPETVNSHLTAVDALTQWLGLGMASRDEHARSLRVNIPASAPRALGDGELKRLLDYVSLLPLSERITVEVLYYTGLRCSELVALDLDDVPLTARSGQVCVREGKGGRPRQVPVARELRPSLERWRAQRLADCDGTGAGQPLLVGRDGRRLQDTGIRRRVARIGRKVGISDLGPHVLRHTFGTRLVRKGVDIATVAQLMGHSRTETTRRYATPTAADQARALDALDVSTIEPAPAAPRREKGGTS